MSPPSGRPGPARYELQVEGHLDEHWSSWFGGLTLVHERDGTTTLSGVVTDQAELHGLLAKVRDLGATLISVKATDGIQAATLEDVESTWRFRRHESAHP
jgi:hypothetical protein